ncbi:hypothetical protein [Rhizobium hidalgonense]|uniref:hypothetical protein n=1 Tax=Rhizobium hidalgonense TaxID=1538159 RepID=UPI001105BD7D|nr:hypothetical protein [Rhizobium hidalgonense]QKK23178.1 hypothetical protein FFM81_007315 [Rhizobium hidalgonense]
MERGVHPARVLQTAIPVAFENDRKYCSAADVLLQTHKATGAKYAVALLSHLKEIIFSTYKKDRSRITWTLCRVNVSRVLLLSHDKKCLEENPTRRAREATGKSA